MPKAQRRRDLGPELQLFRIEAERLKLSAPFSRRIAKPLDADAAGQATFYGCFHKQQMPRQMTGRRSLQHALPPRAQTFEIETAQMRDLVLNGSFGRCTTVAMYLRHRIRPPASRDRQPRTKPCCP